VSLSGVDSSSHAYESPHSRLGRVRGVALRSDAVLLSRHGEDEDGVDPRPGEDVQQEQLDWEGHEPRGVERGGAEGRDGPRAGSALASLIAHAECTDVRTLGAVSVVKWLMESAPLVAYALRSCDT
jgi:hypothetical protein